MWELFIHPSNLIFSIALCLMLLIGLIECILVVLGGGSQGFLDQFLADNILDSSQTELALETDHSFLMKSFHWLGVGRIPLLVWLIVFLTSFSLMGFSLQGIVHGISSNYVTAWLSIPLSLVLSAPILHWISQGLAALIPQDESTAIYSEELIGRTALIILGDAKPDSPAQARVQDQHGQTHYILVEPEVDTVYRQGQEVILTQKTKVGFQASSLTSINELH